MKAADFLDAAETAAPPRASDFLDEPGSKAPSARTPTLRRDEHGSVWRDEAAQPTPDELARAERPASMTRSRRGRPTFVDIPAPIDTSRPIINNADGSFSTERTITIEADGKHFLIPTIVGGKQVSQDQAVAEWRAGRNREVGQFGSAAEAESAAIARSELIGQERGGEARSQRSAPATPQTSAASFLDEPEQPGAMDTVRGVLRQFWDDVRGPRSVMEGYQPSGRIVRPEDRPSPVAPMMDDAYQALDSAVRQMDVKLRERLAARPDVIGTATRKILEDMDGQAGRLSTALERIARPPSPGEIRASDWEGMGKTGLDRVYSDYSSGLVGATGGALAHAGRKLGVEPLFDLGRAMTDYAERIIPAQQTFGDKLVHAVGSMASFYIPGLGVQKGTTALATLSPALARWTGAGTMAGLEAAAEADGIYQANIRAGKAPEEAASRADKAFLANVALLGVTDKLAFFNDIRGIGQRVAVAAALEGPGQEAPQQVIQNYFTDQPLGHGVGEAAAIGAIVGGGARGVQSALEAPAAAAGARQDAPSVASDVRSPVQQPADGVAALTAPADPAIADLRQTEMAAAPAVVRMSDTPVDRSAPGAPLDETAFEAPAGEFAASMPSQALPADAALAGDARSAAAFLDEQDAGPDAAAVSTTEPTVSRAAPIVPLEGETVSQSAANVSGEAPHASPVDKAANGAATSPLNEIPEPTEAQKEAGNYTKGHAAVAGLDISIENPAGTHRRPEWPALEDHYGYIKGVPARAPDKEHVDVFVKSGTPEDFAGNVYVIDQNHANGKFDEPKVMIGHGSREEAVQTYLRNYTPGWEARVRGMAELPIEEFRARLQDPQAFMKPQPDATPLDIESRAADVRASQAAAAPAAEALPMTHERFVARVRAPRSDSASEPQRSTASEPAGDDAQADGEALAATGVLMTPPYAATGAAVDDAARARPDAIRQAIRTLFNVPINERHFKKSRDTLGIYKIKPRTIRVKNQNDIGVIAHETGHHFSETSRPVRVLMKTHEKELRSITPYAAQQKSAALQREEGFAEYLRLAWTQPAQAQALAPGFHAAFAQYVDKNGHRKVFDAIEGAIRDWENLPPADRILAKVGVAVARPSRQELVDRFIFEVLDRWLPLKRMVADLKPGIVASKDPFKASHLLAGDSAVIEDWIATHTIPFDPTRRADPKNYGKSLRDILKPVAKQLNEFKAYAIAVRANELRKADKEHLFTKEEIAEGLKLETPVFKKAADELVAYNERLVDYAEEGGLLSSQIADRLRATGAYTVPFFRESEEGSRHGGGKNPFKRIFGGTENLRDPIANLVQNTANIIYATNRNAVLVKARGLARDVPGGGRWIEDIPIPDKMLNVPTRSILEAFAQQGVTIDPQTAQALAHIQKLIVPNPVEDPAERIVIARVNGEPKAVQINNKLLFKALQSFEPVDLGIVEKLLSVPSDLLRAGVTLSPEFMARNFMRDTLSGFMQSKPGLLPIVGTAGGFKEVATRSDAAKLYRAFGGAYADLWKGESTQTAKTLERMAKRGKFDPRSILTPAGVLRALRALGSISEAGTRVAEFKKTAKAKPGDVDSLIEAAYNAREVSVDFGMHGANPAVRMLTRITPFLNPALQGFYKAGRSGRERFGLTLFRGSFLTAFSVGLFLLNRGEDWYDEIEQWERNVYWHFDVGLRDEDDQVIPLRIPKPFEWGALFGSIPEALTELAIAQHGKDFAKRLGSIFEDVFGLRAIPTALLVPVELWSNKNTFTDRPIVAESKEALDPEFQHGNYASLTARELGALTDTSPAKIDHAIRGIFGTMGVYSVMLADIAARQAGDYPELPPRTWRQLPVVKAFVHDPDNPNSRHITAFYELLKDARRREATLRRVYEGTDKADAYEQKHEGLLDVLPDANRTARRMSERRRDNDEILSDRDLTADEKRDIVNENNRTIKREAKNFMLEAVRQGVK